MSEQQNLSRDLTQDELPVDADETLEEARTVPRKPLASGQRASGSEDRAGTVGRPSAQPMPGRRPEFKAPPFEPTSY